MKVGIVDVGGNTARLLVAGTTPRGIERIAEKRVVLGLGAEIERKGRISKAKLAATRATVADLCSTAYVAGCTRVDVIVTSPGRQSGNRTALVQTLTAGLDGPVQFVSGEEEAELAHAGAVACTPLGACGLVAVCDVGGGSTEIAIGTPGTVPAWTRSLELGSLRLTHRYFSSVPPSKRETRLARAAVRAGTEAIGREIPRPSIALASGGTARALRKIVGKTLGPDELKDALRVLRASSTGRIARRFDIPPWRAAVLPGGAILLTELQHVLGVPLIVASGGVREGAALRLLEGRAAAA